MSHRWLIDLKDGRLGVTTLKNDDPAHLPKTLFELGRHLIPDGNIPDAVKARVLEMYPNASIDALPHLWRMNIHFSEYSGPALLTCCHDCDEADLPYHICGNGDPSHGACSDPNCHDRYFRDALVPDARFALGFRVDKAKTEAIHMDHIRVARNAELAKQDVVFMRAVEAGDTAEQTRVAALKQTLRDIPQTFDLTVHATPEDLKAAWPVELPRA